MRTLIVFAHPEPRSFSGALKDAAAETLRGCGDEVTVSDLYAEGFAAVATRTDFIGAADPELFRYQNEQRAAAADQAKGRGFAADIAREQSRLRWADFVIFQFPMWWFSTPAILKGWFDRVLAVGFAYGGGRWFETAPLGGRRALLSVTMGAKQDRWGPGGLFGDLDAVLHPIRVGTLNFCGFEVLKHHIVHAPAAMTDQERFLAIEQWRSRLLGIHLEAPLPFHLVSEYADAAHRDQ